MLLRSNAEGAVRVESRGEVLNQFLVEVFGQILKAEAACLAGKDLSLRELHLIDAVCRAVDQGGDNRSTAIAAALGITGGTCSAAGMNATSGWYTCCRPSGAGPPTRATGTFTGRWWPMSWTD